MSSLRKITIAIAVAALFSGGCCLTKPCGTYAGCGVGPDCGATGMVSAGCDAGCGDIPCAGGGTHGGCLGLGRIGKLFSMTHYGCGGCGAGIAGGCGETYYHDWISDPPCPDPCDGAGNYTGILGAACDDCGGGCGGSCGAVNEVIVDPGCGASGCGLAGGRCSQGGCLGGRTCFQHTGRLFYHTWTGVGRLAHGIKLGFLPLCRTCNAFSLSHQCAACSTGPYVGYAGSPLHTGTVVTNNSGVPHEIVSQQIQTAHGRPPHKVLSKRLR